MSDQRLMVQLLPEACDAVNDIVKEIEKSGGKMMPAPRVFPIILHFTASKEATEEFKTKYKDSIMKIQYEAGVDDE